MKGTSILVKFLQSGILATTSMLASGEPLPNKPKSAPPLTVAPVESACLDCEEEKFGVKTHSEILSELIDNTYLQSLRNALYFQDTAHQASSRAHFDNCDIQGSIKYIHSRLDLAGTHANSARGANGQLHTGEMKKAFFALGQALHAVQDFYAHTNYVELISPSVTRMTELQPLLFWREGGQEAINQLIKRGLVSGRVWWGFPKLCKSSTPTHEEMAKDSPSGAGAVVLMNIKERPTSHDAAKFLATRASVVFLQDAYQRWPELRTAGGPTAAFEVMLDQRNPAVGHKR